MKKAGRKVLAREQAAAAALEAERARDLAIEEAKKDLLREVREEEERVALEEREQPMRERQLGETLRLISERESNLLEDRIVGEEEEAWIRYMTCDGLPDPAVPSDMNTFMYHWTMGDEEADMTIVGERCDVVARLLSRLDDIVRFSANLSERRVQEYLTIGFEFRDKLYRWIDIGCYRVLRGLERNASREDSRMILRYVRDSSRAVCCLWAPLPLPIGIEGLPDRERKAEEVRFEEIEATIKMPNDLDCDRAAIRALWLEQDRYSEEASTSAMPIVPEDRRWESRAVNLLDFSQKEYLRKLRIREEQHEERRARLEEKRAIIERMENPEAAPIERKSKQSRAKRAKRPKVPRSKPVSEGSGASVNEMTAEADAETAPIDRSDRPGTGSVLLPHLSTTTDAVKETIPRLPTPEEVISREEEDTRRELRELFSLRCHSHEVNLRKYKILGGLFRVDLIQQPPQPKDLGRETFLTTLQLPKEPMFMDFRRPYEPPPAAPDSERTPEVIEEEMKALEAAMEALVLITLKLPSSVLWIEPPLIAHWIPENKSWSTEDVHDAKYNEEKQTISFRTGRLGVHGLAAYKFVHLPFQGWELKPETGRSARGGVVLAVTAATVQAEFLVREDLACLKSIATGGSSALKGILGQFLKPEHLVERMREAGCDLFPEDDAASYLKGIATKHPFAERHAQECISLLCTAYGFSWSRWNATRGYREIVLQAKELHGCVAKERSGTIVLVTPSRTVPLACTELSPEFSDSPLEGEENEFYADLYQYAMRRAGIKSRSSMRTVSSRLASTVVRLLRLTNVIDFSS